MTPGPLRAFVSASRARRGRARRDVAVARKLVVLFWHLLTRGEDYAFARPASSRRKIRTLELTAGAPRAQARPERRPSLATRRADDAERGSPTAESRLPPAGQRLAVQRPEGGCGRDTGARISKALEGQGRAAGHKLLTPALRHVSHPHPTRSLPQGAPTRQTV